MLGSRFTKLLSLSVLPLSLLSLVALSVCLIGLKGIKKNMTQTSPPTLYSSNLNKTTRSRSTPRLNSLSVGLTQTATPANGRQRYQPTMSNLSDWTKWKLRSLEYTDSLKSTAKATETPKSVGRTVRISDRVALIE